MRNHGEAVASAGGSAELADASVSRALPSEIVQPVFLLTAAGYFPTSKNHGYATLSDSINDQL